MATQATSFTFYHLVFNNLQVEFKALRLSQRVTHHEDSARDDQQVFLFACGYFLCPY